MRNFEAMFYGGVLASAGILVVLLVMRWVMQESGIFSAISIITASYWLFVFGLAWISEIVKRRSKNRREVKP